LASLCKAWAIFVGVYFVVAGVVPGQDLLGLFEDTVEDIAFGADPIVFFAGA
jgi:hypothetical protein